MSEQSAVFESVDAVVDALREHGYIADIRLATLVFLVVRLDKPLLDRGPGRASARPSWPRRSR